MDSKDITSIINNIEKSIKIRVLSKKYSIIFFLYIHPNASAKDICERCSLSKSTFFLTVRELISLNIINSHVDSEENFGEKYQLSKSVRSFLDSVHSSMEKWMTHKLNNYSDKFSISFVDLVHLIERYLKITYYSVEFQIIIYLYGQNSATQKNILENTSYSNTSVASAIRNLFSMGVISYEINQHDKRSKVYEISPLIRRSLDEAHRQISENHLYFAKHYF